VAFGALHLPLLIEIRLDDPLVQGQRGPRRLKNLPAIDDAQGVIHAQPQPLEHGGEVPGIDALAVDGRLAPHRLEPGAIEEGGSRGWVSSAWSSRAMAPDARSSAASSAAVFAEEAGRSGLKSVSSIGFTRSWLAIGLPGDFGIDLPPEAPLVSCWRVRADQGRRVSVAPRLRLRRLM